MAVQSGRIIINTDGGSRGNPGPAAAGFVLTDGKGNQIAGRGIFIGRATNNVAEYTAVCKALEAAEEFGASEVQVFSDSELVVKQINGQYKVKNANMKPLYQTAIGLLGRFRSWKVTHVRREKNEQADRLVNEALDVRGDVEAEVAVSEAKGKAIRLGVLISGGGTTLFNILKYIEQGKLNAEVGVVISSQSTAGGVKKAEAAGLDVKIVRKKDYADIDEFSGAIEDTLIAADVDLVVQGGWLCLWKIPQRYEGRVMNIHPALLPSFGGQGMWGHHVHEAVLTAGVKVSGCTVHFCTNEYDKGPIIVQRCCEVKEDDDADSIAARVFEQECLAYPEAIRLYCQGKLVVEGTRVRIKS